MKLLAGSISGYSSSASRPPPAPTLPRGESGGFRAAIKNESVMQRLQTANAGSVQALFWVPPADAGLVEPIAQLFSEAAATATGVGTGRTGRFQIRKRSCATSPRARSRPGCESSRPNSRGAFSARRAARRISWSLTLAAIYGATPLKLADRFLVSQ
jgi:hypothetical protein